MISSNLELHRYATGRQSRVVTAMTLLKSHLFRYVEIAIWLLSSSSEPANFWMDTSFATGHLMILMFCRNILTCRYQGQISAALVLGGVDFSGPHLFTVRTTHDDTELKVSAGRLEDFLIFIIVTDSLSSCWEDSCDGVSRMENRTPGDLAFNFLKLFNSKEHLLNCIWGVGTSTWLHRQLAFLHNGFWQPCSHGSFWSRF